MKSGAGVLVVASLQLVVAVVLLGIYEGYKTKYFNSSLGNAGEGLTETELKLLIAERSFFFRTPLDYLFTFSCFAAAAAVFGLAGIFSQQPTLVTVFFAYNLVQTVVSLALFVDVLADQKLRWVGQAAGVTGYEKAAAAFLFLNCLLALSSGYFAVQAVAEIKHKKREQRYQEMSSVVSDTLQFEPDMA